MRHKAFDIFFLLFLFSATLTGCSVTDDPDNLEPEIRALEARDVTRTEATLGAEIVNRGSGRLSELYFRYGRDENMDSRSENLVADKDAVEMTLTGLTPGATYYYCAEGGNGNALVRSETRQFTTVPNDAPTLSGAEILSSGPVGVIIGFGIEDDGGSTVTSAGCIVTDNSNGETRKVLCTVNPPLSNTLRVNVFGLSLKTHYTITPFAVNGIGETRGEPIQFTTRDAVMLDNPGSLEQLFGSSPVMIDTLRIAGKMNGDDFRFLRLLLKAPLLPSRSERKSTVHAVDLANLDIVEGGDTYDGMRYTENNVVTRGLFADCAGLRWIRLPETATALMREAFSGSAIETIIISSGISLVEPSAGCDRLEKIEVSGANSRFCSVDGVLMNREKTSILWVPLAGKGKFDIPEGIVSLGMNVFRGCGFTEIILPSTLKTLGRGAFSQTQLESIELPELVEQVPEGLFQESGRLTSVTLGKNVNYIADYAFDRCPLKSLTVKAGIPPYVTDKAFASGSGTVLGNCTLYVPKASVAVYRNHSQWGKFSNITGY